MTDFERDSAIREGLEKVNSRIEEIDKELKSDSYTFKTDCIYEGKNISGMTREALYNLICTVVDHRDRFNNLAERVYEEYGIGTESERSNLTTVDNDALDDLVHVYKNKKLKEELDSLKTKKKKLDSLFSEMARKDSELAELLKF